MAQIQRPYIAREGWPFVAAAFAGAAVVHSLAGGGWAAPFWLAAAALLYLFRDPERQIPPAPLGVVSPADGRVIEVASGRDPFLDREAIRIAIRLRPAGPFVTRSPIEGKVMKQLLLTEGQKQTETAAMGGRYGIWLQSDEGDDVVFAVRGTRWGLRPSCYVRVGERIGQGQRCGLVPFGGAAEVWVPADARVHISAGDRVRAGADVIATLIHPVPGGLAEQGSGHG